MPKQKLFRTVYNHNSDSVLFVSFLKLQITSVFVSALKDVRFGVVQIFITVEKYLCNSIIHPNYIMS